VGKCLQGLIWALENRYWFLRIEKALKELKRSRGLIKVLQGLKGFFKNVIWVPKRYDKSS
jgi:hypothetical protein